MPLITVEWDAWLQRPSAGSGLWRLNGSLRPGATNQPPATDTEESGQHTNRTYNDEDINGMQVHSAGANVGVPVVGGDG